MSNRIRAYLTVLLCGICAATLTSFAFPHEAEPTETEQTEPTEITVVWENVEVVKYEPVLSSSGAVILPEDVANLDGFERDVCLLAQTLWGESRGMSEYENSLVAWCICNRVDSDKFPDTVEEVVRQPYQFYGYSPDNPIDARLYEIAADTYARWKAEPYLAGESGRTLPQEYLYFYGKDGHNKYRITNSGEGRYDFTDELPSPYSE